MKFLNSICLAILLLAVVLFAVGCGCNVSDPGTGEKVGQVVRLNKQGFACKTWEGQLLRGGLQGGSGAIGMVPYEFTVEDASLVEVVQRHMRDQTEVAICYRQERIWWVWRSDSRGHFLMDIKPLTEAEKGK